MTNERGQKQFRYRLRAVHNGKDYVYYVLCLDPEHPDSGEKISLDMTEAEVRDKPLREAREAAARRLSET